MENIVIAFLTVNLYMMITVTFLDRDWKGYLTILIIDILAIVLLVVGFHYGLFSPGTITDIETAIIDPIKR